MQYREKILNDNAFLVSETDSKGIITYANEEFCNVAEYKLEELVGMPHNIVRHDDMPKAAFDDLWKTVKEDKVWQGFVKNKSKSGNFYWVYATVYPFETCSGANGFLSCRRKASTEEIMEYTALYKQMKAKE